MRRPILIILFFQAVVILILIEGLDLKLYPTSFTPYYDSVATINGIVKSVQIKETYTALTVDIGRENLLIRLKITNNEDYIFDLVGRKIIATGKVTEPDGRRNPRPV